MADNQTGHRWNPSETQLKHGEHVGGDGAKPASPDHPRRAPPLRVSAGMSEFDGRRGGVRHGWGPAYESLPQGLERAPPRLIPWGGHHRCFPLFAVTPPIIPTGVGRP